MSAQEGREGGKEESSDGGASLAEAGRRSCIVDRAGGRADCVHGAAVSVKFSRPTLNGPFATPLPLRSPLRPREIPSVYVVSVFRGDALKKTFLNSTFERRRHSSESRQLFPRTRDWIERVSRDSRVKSSTVLHRSFLFLPFPVFSFPLFFSISPCDRETANRKFPVFAMLRANVLGAANVTKKRLE